MSLDKVLGILLRRFVMLVTLLGLAAVVTVGPAIAGKFYEGWGATPQDAMDAAIKTAVTTSPAKCIGKDWSPNMERDCRRSESLGGFVCRAEGSNHLGSCMRKSDLEKFRDSVVIYKLLFPFVL